jgi:hypothetical protein
MQDREYFKARAAVARAAAISAADVASCRVRMDMAKEYEFRAAMEPHDKPDASAESDLPSLQQRPDSLQLPPHA